MTVHELAWKHALLDGKPGSLIQTLLERLNGAKNAEQRAALRDEFVTYYLETHQNGQDLAVLLHLVFKSRYGDEFGDQIKASEACARIQRLSEAERHLDASRNAADQRTVACCAAVENWGSVFLDFASRNKWFDKVGTGEKQFWRSARSASNRVSDWVVAKSMLNFALLHHRLKEQNWKAVVDDGYLTMTRGTDLDQIRKSAPQLDNKVINRYGLMIIHNDEIDFRNWRAINSAIRDQQISRNSSPLSSHRSSISPTLSPRHQKIVNSVSHSPKNTDALAPSAPMKIVKVGSTKSARATTRTKNVRRRLIQNPDITEDDENHHQKNSVTLIRAPGAEIYLADCDPIERKQHEEREHRAKELLTQAYDYMQDTLDQAIDRPKLNRDQLFDFALARLKSFGMALEWNEQMPETLRDRADVWSFTNAEAMNCVNHASIIPKPIIIRGQDCEHVARASWFFRSLVDELGLDYEMDVQGNGSEPSARKVTLEQLEQDFFLDRKTPGSIDFDPINCLKVPLVDSQEGDPPFMCHPRFGIGDKIQRRLKKPTLLGLSRMFNVFSTILTVSRFHKDAFNGTWVKCLAGIKAWFFLDPSAEEGDFETPAPENIRCILLFPGDVLYMPAGLSVPHAVVTVCGPCLMAGGQRLDKTSLIPQLKEIYRMMREPSTTNEDVPRSEFRAILSTLLTLIKEDPKDFEDPKGLRDTIVSIQACLQN